MKVRLKASSILLFVWLAVSAGSLVAQQTNSVYESLDAIATSLQRARSRAAAGDLVSARSEVVRAYLDHFEVIEGHYGPGAQYGKPPIAAQVLTGEAAFHTLMRSDDAATLATGTSALELQLGRIRDAIARGDVPTSPGSTATFTRAHDIVRPAAAQTSEIREILDDFAAAATRYASGDEAAALALVERAYLEGFEPLESRLPADLVGRFEKRIHLELRPAIKRGGDSAVVASLLGLAGADLLEADRILQRGSTTLFAAVNSFVIILREGLEAVLLIGALLAYLAAVGAHGRHRRQIYAGVTAGVVASIGTWFIARSLVPISGANRELIEGITALIAVAVLLYVAHWLFQKTYIHDWKDYLRTRVGGALTRGSGFAMAALAFAAVYREGFETVLFYQALAFDAGAGAIVAGFVPGALLIGAVAVGIIRAGLRLPLRKVFTFTNTVLLYLAFVFIGKGIYNLQEAGIFAPLPLPLPDHPALRQLFGFYPLVQTLAAQTVFGLLLAGTYVGYHLRRRAASRISGPDPRTARPPAQHDAARPAWRDNRRSQPAAPSADPPPARARSRQ